MGQIHQMDAHLATLIAAGEVIANPAAVVRELIDNALDAGARAIEITLHEGGLGSIRVADDGSGMDRDDARLCLSRHATSKIRAAEDLESIGTLGFRGEALASILAVSRLRIETRRAEDEAGTAVSGAGGEAGEVRTLARRPGTTVEVSHLFYNTPARRAFQDTARAETARVVQTVQRAALANPSVRFVLGEGRRQLLAVPAAPTLIERIRQVYGGDFAAALLPVQAQRGDVCVCGFVCHPAAAVRRARRSAFAVNGRPFESFEMRRLLSTTFGPLLAGGSHVEAVLRVDLPRADVDVNVSPEKSQVRFRRPGQVLAAVNDALRGALGEEQALMRLAAPGALPPSGAPVPPRPPSGDAWGALFAERRQGPRHRIAARPPAILQVCGSYLVAPAADGVLIVDQHSAHERVHYERLRERFGRLGRNPDVQMLLFPLPVPAGTLAGVFVDEILPFLLRLGFDLAPGGPRGWLLQSVPAALGTRAPLPALRALAEAYADARESGVKARELGGELTPLEDRMLKTLACHAAMKAGEAMSEVEMKALWADLATIDLAGHDIHGRPAILVLDEGEIARRMGR